MALVHEIWSTDYFRNPDSVIEEAKRAYEKALTDLEQHPLEDEAEDETPTSVPNIPLEDNPTRTHPLRISAGRPSTEYTDRDLADTVQWISSDGLVRTDAELLADTMQALSFRRKGARITERINNAIRSIKSG